MEFLPVAWVPVFIFFARILDVSLGTLRIVFVSRGLRTTATIVGFVEILIWITVVAQVFQNLDNWVNYVAFAGGFAAGTFVGMTIEHKLKMGVQICRIISQHDTSVFIQQLASNDFRVTAMDAEGTQGEVKILFIIVRRKRIQELTRLIYEFDPKAIYSIEDVKHASEFIEGQPVSYSGPFSRLMNIRKGK